MKYKVGSTVILVIMSSMMLMCNQGNQQQSTPASKEEDTTKTSKTFGQPPPGVPIIPVADGPRPKDNSFCYVCHEGMENELITHEHESNGILCIDCHGPSTLHMEDEMLMTKPDVLYGRTQVELFCKTCHEAHKYPEKVEAFREEQRGRDQSNGRVVNSYSICTDCHGTHNIASEKHIAEERAAREKVAWIPLFNGKDLSGWEAVGKAKWAVENGTIVGTQGKDYAPGDLLTKDTYKDFMLTCTYRVEWPCNSGIWFRYQSEDKAYQADILEEEGPAWYSGSLYCPGKKFIAENKDKDLVDREGWNTISLRAEGEHLQIWINGAQVADVRDNTTDSGRIGFQIHPGNQFGPMKITISEIMLQKLGAS